MNPEGTDPNLGLPRIVVAAPMKSGSSYVRMCLIRYFAIANPIAGMTDYDWQAEHALTSELLAHLRGFAFCQNYHMLPYARNLSACAREHIALVVVWRSLADMIVSLADHQVRQPGSGPALFLMDPAKFTHLDADARYAFLIDFMIPWYVGFYQRWRAVNAVLQPYEQMVADPHTYLADLLTQTFEGLSPDLARIDAAVVAEGAVDRLNVGQAGRSAAALSEGNKRRLEDKLLGHPDLAQLEVLLWELPWDVPALAPRSELDGAVVRAASDPTPHFVSRGVAYPVRGSWVASRTGERRTPRIVGDEILARYPRGETLL